MRAPAEWIASSLEIPQRIVSRSPNIEATPIAAPIAFIQPPHIAPHLVGGIEAAALNQAFSKAQRH